LATVSTPIDIVFAVSLFPLQSPLAVQVVAEFAEDHVKDGFTTFTTPLVGFTEIVTTGIALTTTVALFDTVPEVFEQVSVYVYVFTVLSIPIVWLPPATAFAPDQLFDAVQLVGEFVVVHVRIGFTTFTAPLVGEAINVMTGATTDAFTVTVALTDALVPPAFVQVSVYVYVLTVVSTPID